MFRKQFSIPVKGEEIMVDIGQDLSLKDLK